MDSSRFKSVIKNHPIFDKLGSTDPDFQPHTKPDQLIHIGDGNLFLWNNKESSLHVSNLRISLDEQIPSVQTCLCTSPPLFEVKSIAFNDVGNLVALVGSRGVSVLTLPQRWHRNFGTQDEDSKVVCICIPVAERYFMTCIAVQLLQASWHPGSSTNSHLCLLLTDNTFRIFDVTADNQTPIQVHKLGHFSNVGSSRLSLVSSAYSISTAIGETVISFAFAPPVEVLEKKKRIFQAKPAHEQCPAVLLYPVYLLQGDGDVLLLLTSITDKRYRRGLMHGPLTMRPPAEDNYGVDACSILVLKSTPTAIAIATASGKIHHCVALSVSDYDSDDDFTETQSTSSWPASVLSVKSGGLPGSEFPAPTLFVYETVEIDLDLMKNPEDEEDIQNRGITLHPDPLMNCRYHCCTRVGVHTVVLPWMEKMSYFLESTEENKDDLLEIAQDQPCIVEHIVCTKPTPSSSLCAIKGLTIATNPCFGPSLLCLTDDNHCSALPLLSVFKPAPSPLLTFGDSTATRQSPNETAPFKKLAEVDFQDHIRSVLKRDTSQPILRYESSSRDNMIDSECRDMINRVTQVLRQEYIVKQKFARDAIEKRVQLLSVQKSQQTEELEQLKDKRQELTDTAHQLADKYEDCSERQDDLSKRLEIVLKHIQSKVPVLSKAEIEMAKELKTMQDQMKHLQNKIKQVKIKLDYQKEQSTKDREGEASGDSKSTASFGNALQRKRFKNTLLEEGHKIHELIKKLNNMKMQVGL